MHTESILIKTNDGDMECFISRPHKNGTLPTIIFYMDIPGIRQELIEMSERIANEGFYCILPDLYYRDGRIRFDLNKGGEELKKMFAQGQKLTTSGVMKDTSAIIKHVTETFNETTPVGCIGYCMSGQYVLTAAGKFPDRIKAAASLYGVRMVTDSPQSPHKLAKYINAELYFGFAEEDPYVEDFVIPRLTDTLNEHKVNYTLEIHKGTEHGFCFPQRPAYDQLAAESVWNSTLELFRKNLRP